MSDEIFPADEHVTELKRAIEASVMVAQDPVAPELLAQLLEQPVAAVEAWCEELKAEYAAQNRGFEFCRVAGGYRYQSHPDLTPYVERFVLHDQKARLSGAALETLAIIAYKQPISRAQIASIRGVDPDGVIRTLQRRGYVDEVGRDDGPGQAYLLGTTAAFLEKLGLDSIDDLPPIAEFIPGADVVETLEQGLRIAPDPELAEVPTPEPTAAPTSESGLPDGQSPAPDQSVATDTVADQDDQRTESDRSSAETNVDVSGSDGTASANEPRADAGDGGVQPDADSAGASSADNAVADGSAQAQPGAEDGRIGPESNGR